MEEQVAKAPSKYRFVIGLMICISQMVIIVSFSLVSPLVTVISRDTGIELSLVGYLATAFMLSVGVSVMGATFILEKLGVRRSMLLAMTLSAVGGIAMLFAQGLAAMLVCRIVAGIGLGIVGTGFSAVTVAWFPQRERPGFVTVYTLSSSLVSAACFAVAIPLLTLLHNSWRMEFALLGFAAAVMALFWVVLGRDATKTTAVQIPPRRAGRGGLLEALKRRDVRMITYASATAAIAENVLITYLPSFLETVRGYDADTASLYAGLVATVGIGGTVVGGAVSSALGRRRPVFILGAAGAAGSLALLLVAKATPLLLLGIAVFGFMYRYKLPALQTAMTELPGVTPAIAAGGYGLMFGIGYVLGIFTPRVMSAVTQAFGMEAAMLLFAGLMAVSAVISCGIRETGPRAARPARR